MNTPFKITSANNPRVKEIQHLSKSRERREKSLFVIEGFREISLAMKSAYEFVSIWHCPGINPDEEIRSLLNVFSEKDIPVFTINEYLFHKIAYRENSDGLLAIAKTRDFSLESLRLTNNPLIIVLEAVEKPGNLGAILRTADAAAVDAVVICDAQTDVFNPNVVRSSIGCLFTNQIALCSTREAINYFRQKQISTYAAALTASEFYQDVDFRQPSAIVMGTEADGLSETWLGNCDRQIKIPMCGDIDSLNVSTSAAILVFEAKRQRGFK